MAMSASYRTNRKTKKRFPVGKLTYAQRQKLRSSQFVFPGRRAYPIDTPNRARNALARVSAYGTDYEKSRVCAAVSRRYPEIHAKSCPMHGDM